jgi:UDP-N-acetylglucosamine diphosphorylase/glucosamine-1-phosphate N-acetyltransferase
MKICIYEDDGYKWFGPLTNTRAVWSLRCGAWTLEEKIRKHFKDFPIYNHVRLTLRELSLENGIDAELLNPEIKGDQWLFINGRVILTKQSVTKIINRKQDTVFTVNGKTAAFLISNDYLKLIDTQSGEPIDSALLQAVNTVEIEGELIDYPWQLVSTAAEQISADLELAESGNYIEPSPKPWVNVSVLDKLQIVGDFEVQPGVVIDAGKHTVRIEKGVRLGAGVVLDASEGPIWLAEDAKIETGALLMGPVYIGSGSIVRPGARLSDGVCLGPQCRVGGEVSQTIFQGYSNKQHSGYLGTSYIGSWVNLGAATDNSDLKNNYRPISVLINGEIIDSGDLHVGVFMGDFCRTAIQTRLNSGTVIGVCCNLFGADFPEKNVPAFTWIGSDGSFEYRLDKALDTIDTMMRRRNKELTPALEKVLRDIHKKSYTDR